MITSALQAVSLVRRLANSSCSVCAERKSGDRLDLRMDGWIDGWMHLRCCIPGAHRLRFQSQLWPFRSGDLGEVISEL